MDENQTPTEGGEEKKEEGAEGTDAATPAENTETATPEATPEA